MKKQRENYYNCVICGKEFYISLVQSVNDPESNHGICPECGGSEKEIDYMPIIKIVLPIILATIFVLYKFNIIFH